VRRVRRRGQHHPFGAELPRPSRQRLRLAARPGEVDEFHAESAALLLAPEVDDVEVPHVKPPQATTLAGWIDLAARCGAPLGPGGFRIERRVERPRIAGSVAARVARRRAVGREGGRVEARLAMDSAAEAAERAQT
jgi:hypothetical protein